MGHPRCLRLRTPFLEFASFEVRGHNIATTDAFTLVGWVNGVDANGSPLLRAIDFVMDETHFSSVLLCYKEAIPSSELVRERR